jgi:hypothetical protein
MPIEQQGAPRSLCAGLMRGIGLPSPFHNLSFCESGRAFCVHVRRFRCGKSTLECRVKPFDKSRNLSPLANAFDKPLRIGFTEADGGKKCVPMAFKSKQITPAVSLPQPELRNLQTLKPYQHNARTHSKRQRAGPPLGLARSGDSERRAI